MKDEETVKRFFNHMGLVYSTIKEYYFETFDELIQDRPDQAIEKFPEVLDQILSQGNGLFKGTGCGGPAPEATVPMLNIIGGVYPQIPRHLREVALSKCLKFLDGLNYFNSQNNVERINEPWLNRDIIVNRGIYWPGYKEYASKLQGKLFWNDLEGELLRDNGDGSESLNVKSMFWFAYTLGRAKEGPEYVRRTFTEFCPEIVNRTKDAIAAIIACESAGDAIHDKVDYGKAIKEHMNHYAPEWREDLVKKINQRDWILFRDHDHPEVYEFLEAHKEPVLQD